MQQVIVITGASSGFGALTSRALAEAGHIVYASMRETKGRNAPRVEEVRKLAKEKNVDLRAMELDVASQDSVDAAIQQLVKETGRLDVVIHNVGHMVFGPAEAFTPEQLAEAIRRKRAEHATGQSRRFAANAKARTGSPGVGLEQQFGWWYAALSGAVLRCQSGDGRTGSAICARADALGHRDFDHRARRLHWRYKPLCTFWPSCGCIPPRGVRSGSQ